MASSSASGVYKRSLSGRSQESSSSLSSFIASEPEKERLSIAHTEIDPEYASILGPVEELVNEKLWHWKRFPVVLPEPIIHKNQDGTLSARRKTLRLNQLFRTPNFNELKQIAVDSSGQPKKLSARQLDSIKKTGEFEIDSVQFPGQKHRWIVTQLLIKGKLKAHETMNKDLARALYLIYSTARHCLDSDPFSLLNSLNGWSQGLMNLLDIFFGAPLMRTVSLKDKIQEERAKYLVAELSCISSDTLKALTDYLETLLRHSKAEGDPPPLPYLFRSPSSVSQDIDLRLFSNDVMSTAKPHLLHLLSSCLKGWFLERKQELLDELRKESNNLSEDEIVQRASAKLKEEYIKRVCEAVRNDLGIQAIGTGIPDLLIEQMKTSLIIEEILRDTKERIRDHRDKEEKKLRSSQPILCHIQPWMKRQLDQANEAFISKHKWDPHDRAIEECKQQGLEQSAYFLARDLTFMRDREPVLKKELRNLKYPEKTFSFKTYIWLPKNYIVKERKQSDADYETIPTVISESSEYQYLTSSGSTPNPSRIQRSPEQPVDRFRFILIKEKTRINSTKYPFWRWTNFFLRTWAWLWNALFLLGIVVPWCSPLSFQALFRSRPFFPEHELNRNNGALQKSRSSKTHTVSSRLSALWSHIRESRKEFETQPDTGLLSKNLTRHFHRFVNYVLKGFFGSLFLLLVFPAAILSVSVTSALLALTCPIWLPVVSTVVHLFCALICDFDGEMYLNAVVWNILINIIGMGILQPILALLTAFVVCPILCWLLTLWAIVRKGIRDMWDAIVFQLLIKKRARIPDHNSFLAKRIAGPGMAANYFYQIKPEQALVALETRLELAELEAYEDEIRARIVEPRDFGTSLIRRLFKPFGALPTRKTTGPIQQLEQESDQLLNVMRERLTNRREHLESNLPSDVRSRIRLNDSDLRVVLHQGVLMVKDFYPPRVFSRFRNNKSKEDRAAWWEQKGLVLDDWLGLTSLLLSEFFTPEFLTPLQEEDVCFQLKVEHWNLERYVNMALDTKWHDDLDMTNVTRLRTSNSIVKQPMISIESFNPVCAIRNSFSLGRHSLRWWSTRWYVYHKRSFDPVIPLTCPVPVAPPAEIVLVIYQRDNASINFNVEAIRAKLSMMQRLNMPIESLHGSLEDMASRDEDDHDARSSSVTAASHDDVTPTNSLYDFADEEDFQEAQDRLKLKRRQQARTVTVAPTRKD